jgi:hypothetical protein
LLKVLQCCAADDQRSLFSAARAHSRLQQLAVAALRSITARAAGQQQIDSVVMYLTQHGHHLDSLDIRNTTASAAAISELPPDLQLTSLQFEMLRVQLQPGNGSQGVLRAAALKQLELRECSLLDDRPAEALEAAVVRLPALA